MHSFRSLRFFLGLVFSTGLFTTASTVAPAAALDLMAMGLNNYGQLGDGTTTNRNRPELIAVNVQKIAAEGYHSLIEASGDIGLHAAQIGVEPQDQTVLAGATVEFTVGGLGGGPFSYQWFKDGVLISGATGDTLSLPNVTQADASGYSAVVANVVDGVPSRTASLVVNGLPEITAQSPNRAAPAGESTSFSVTVSGTAPFSFQWQRNGVDLVDGGGVSGATTATLVLSNVQSGDAGRYTVVIGNDYGTVTSPAATLEVNRTVYVFTTVAGRPPQAGSGEGWGAAARFNSPGGVAWDADGNLYVADSGNSTIRKITLAGVVTTLAGQVGNGGSADGTGTDARFGGLNGAATDGAGNLYVADGNNTIRKITLAGVVTTLAGLAGTSGIADGTGSDARFNGPGGIVADLSGNLYVADSNNHTIRKVTPEGVVTTLAGLAGNSGSADGAGSAARFNGPRGVAVDLSGNLYVADGNNSTIRRVTPAGVVTTLAGLAGVNGSTDGVGIAARFKNTGGLAIDGVDTLYVADTGNHVIRRVTPAGEVTTLAGLAGRAGDADGLGAAARFAMPGWVSVNAGGTVAVADTGNNTIRTITPAGQVTTLAGRSGESIGNTDGRGDTARFFGPNGAVRDAENNFYVLDNLNHTIRRITPDGVVSTFADLAGFHTSDVRPANGFVPSGLARDGAGNLYVTDTVRNSVLKVTPAGVVSMLANVTDGSGALTGIAVDHSGNVFVGDTWSHTIRRITPAGEVSVFAGQIGTSGSADGVGADARFCGPSGLVMDGADNLYVADTWNHVIRKITPAGVVSSLTGPARTWWTGLDGPNTVEAATRFSYPTGLARDDAGNLYVTEYYGNDRVWKVTPDGMVSWIAGRIPGSADGVGVAARFNYPSGIVVDTSGNLYVTDFGNNTIRKGVPITLARIDVQPTAQTVVPGGSASFTVVASGTPFPTLRWEESYPDRWNSFTSLWDFNPYSGVTTGTLTITGATLAMNGLRYRCRIENGVDTTTSDTVVLTVIPVRPAYFNAAGYLSRNTDLAAAFGSLPEWADQAWIHYWMYGLNEGRMDGDFDPAAYLAMYPDLQAALGNDLHAATMHWYTYGRAEGRLIPAGFDAGAYLARYPDLQAALGKDPYEAWLHYLNYGVNEGRVFDTKFRAGEYPLLYGDLAALAGDPRGALLHWLNHGRAEGRMGRVPAGFDVAGYLSRYPELAAVFGSLPYPQQWVAAWDHYVYDGINEGRTDGDFDPAGYLAMYGDLRAAFGDNWTLAAMHWYKYGRYEGRRIPAGFNARGYLARYPDVQLDQGDDLYGAWLQYLDWGVYEGRVYDELFRPDEYLAMYPDLQAAFGNDRQKALLHWLYYGQYEGRLGRFP